MNILPKLPEHRFAKVMLFHSHLNQYGSSHGSPFDRGSSDAYYYRGRSPHYWTNGNGSDGGTVYDSTPDETDAYMLEYFGTKIRKNGDDLEGSLQVLLLRFVGN